MSVPSRAAVRYSKDMGARVGSWLAKPVLLKALVEHARLAVRLMREPAVPPAVKAVPVLAGAYLIWPIDVLPDLLPVVGQLDDLGVVLAGLGLFLKLCPPALVAFHRGALTARRKYSPMAATHQPGDIDVEFRPE